MKKLDFCKISFIFACLGLFLPWFSYNPKMTGYLWGIHYVHYFMLPMFFVMLFAFSGENTLWVKIAGVVSALLNIPLLIIAWGRFDIVCFVKDEWAFNTRVLRFGSFISLALFGILLVAVLMKAFKKDEKVGVEEKAELE